MPGKWNGAGIQQFRREAPAALDRGVERGANYTADLAQQLAPEDSGDLKKSKKVVQIGPGKWRISFGEGLPDIRAIAQEYGTIDSPAQPYLGPAIKAVKIEKEVLLELKALVQRCKAR